MTDPWECRIFTYSYLPYKSTIHVGRCSIHWSYGNPCKLALSASYGWESEEDVERMGFVNQQSTFIGKILVAPWDVNPPPRKNDQPHIIVGFLLGIFSLKGFLGALNS